MAGSKEQPGRVAQRRRTRQTIVAAAAGLLAQGRRPSLAEVAEAAEVSRRTVYMYFPTLEQLLIDAALGSMSHDTVDAALDAVEHETDVELRVEAMARAIQGLSLATEQQGRTLMRLTSDVQGRDAGSAAAAPRPPRGYRRVEWIERALAPLRPKLTPARFERLVSAIALVVGFEAFVVERDIRGLSLDDAVDLSAWSARALVRAAVQEAAAAGKRGGGVKSPTKSRRRRLS
ncbi:MAG TPA: TetR family transcriptional regulator [Gemmatimonadaceae bacterium]|nr:TetR family transcriptional regulator [Gemmatimonadaceae bacterium]